MNGPTSLVKEETSLKEKKMETIQTQFALQLKDHEELYKYIEARAKELSASQREAPYESADIKELAAALAKAQGEFPSMDFNRENAYIKNRYADLHAIIASTRKALSSNGLSISQHITLTAEGQTILVTRLRHSSGQWCESRCRINPLKNDPQGFGSALTYMKRYALMSLLGVTGGNDPDDDDGEKAKEERRAEDMKGTSISYNYSKKDESAVNYKTISLLQLQELEAAIKIVQADDPKTYDKLLAQCDIESLADMPEDMYKGVFNRLMDYINNRKRGQNPR
jgi:hypothetical protein